jgi:hypothetical protein
MLELISGKTFADELLKLCEISSSECIVLTINSTRASETYYKKNGTSKIVLRGDDSTVSKIVTAIHEVGHVLNNKKNPRTYSIFKITGQILMGIVLVGLALGLVDLFVMNIPRPLLISVFLLGPLFAIWNHIVKIKDEFGANKEAIKLLYRYTNYVFSKHKDMRNLGVIKNEATKQLKKGLKMYKGSWSVLIALAFSPIIFYLLLKYFLPSFS